MENEFSFTTVCRSCMAETDDLVSIFHYKYDSKMIKDIIADCTQLEVTENDGLPDKVCNVCLEATKNAYLYRKTCIESDAKLREMMQHKFPLKIKIKEEPSNNESYSSKLMLIPIQSLYNDAVNDLDLDDIRKAEPIEAEDYNDDENYNEHIEQNFDEELIILDAKQSDGRYKCKFCMKSLCDRKTFKQHLRQHTGRNLKFCDNCNRGFVKKSHLDRHIPGCIRRSDKDLPANKYPKSESKDTIKRVKPLFQQLQHSFNISHIWNEKNGSKTCRCMICLKTFNKIHMLYKHLYSHATDIDSINNEELLTNYHLIDADQNISKENAETLDNIKLYIKQNIETNNVSRFYQITNSIGMEMSLSDSETDTENEEGTASEEHKEIVVWSGEPKRIGYNCLACLQTFYRKYKLIQHVKASHYDYIFDHKCDQCNTQFPNEILLKQHLRAQCDNKEKNITCNLCNVKFLWQSSYNAHNKILHNDNFNQPIASNSQALHSCFFCVKSFKRRDLLIRHMKTHGIKDTSLEKVFSCQICSKTFLRQENFERHRKTHIPAEKKFSCDLCLKKFNRKDNLKSHVRIHRSDRDKDEKSQTQLCIYCGRSFSNSSNLIVHMRRHTGEKPYKCDFCGKGFPRSSDLQCHRRTHTGEKPCLCTICGKGFSRSNKLVRHMRIHTGVRPYKCTYCGRAFTQSNDLTLHIRRHTGDKPYVCGVCGDRFIQGTALAQHRRMQGHYEDSQPTPFASISINNPSRFTNCNRVERIGMIDESIVLKNERNIGDNLDDIIQLSSSSLSSPVKGVADPLTMEQSNDIQSASLSHYVNSNSSSNIPLHRIDVYPNVSPQN